MDCCTARSSIFLVFFVCLLSILPAGTRFGTRTPGMTCASLMCPFAKEMECVKVPSLSFPMNEMVRKSWQWRDGKSQEGAGQELYESAGK